ncbi:NfrA family protein [Pandoraea commovens]|uniref:TPR repeat-containing protein n=1 Tax=Pandoraea commovens TaxID=2508289 RepID=A0A5E4TBY7_9BURK|nr:tetratricopeptide repeat protein [Pandoraea commovens]UVA79284.1 tetratricopeptide repeat protein [Pandoraea commovens]VVD84453.1 TPR repeat-containing protein [Pandoraea commovens]
MTFFSRTLCYTAVLASLSAGAVAAPASAARAEVPLEGEAWQFGDAAFKAYNRKDYAAAQAQAAKALALRPDVTRLWLLRVYALQNMGRTKQALDVTEQALAQGHRDPALSAARDNLRIALAPKASGGKGGTMQSPAYKAGDAAYKAYAAGRYDEAERNARESLRYEPNSAGMRSLLIYSLERQDKAQAAADEADAALRLTPSDEALQALRDRMHRRLATAPALAAWDAYRERDYVKAVGLARQAVRQAPDVQSYRYLLTGALLSEGQYAEADAAASDALSQDGEDALSLAMRGFARQKLDRPDDARKDFDKAVAQDWLSEQQLASVKRIAADTQQRTGRPRARSAADEAPVVFCTSDSQDVLCNLLPAGSSLAGAGPGYEAASQAYASMARKDYDAAAKAAREALDAAPDNLAYRLLLVNALSLAGRKREAREVYAPIATSGSEVPPESLLDAAYSAQRLYDNKQASYWFSRAIDAADDGQIELEPQARQNVRQAVSDLDRTWGFNAALGYGTVGVMNSAFAPSLSARKTLQSSQEIFWRPPVIGNRDGSTFELYARMNQALYDGTGGVTGLSTNQGVLGARWKPFGRQNFVFAVEKFIPLGSNSRTDWLLRAAWSEGEGGSLRVDKSNWQYWQLYAEGDYFIDHPQTLGTAEARYGRAFRMDSIDSNLVVTPYLGATAGFDSLLAQRFTMGVGPGLTARWWFREDKYHAPQSFIDLNVQYRVRIAGDDRSQGIFAGLYFSY